MSPSRLRYDSLGRLIETSENGGAVAVTYSYNLGEITVTDALGDTSTIWLNQLGEVAQAEDALGNMTYLHYNASGQLVSEIGPDGSNSSIELRRRRRRRRRHECARRHQTQASFNGPFNTMSQLVDPLGNVTQFTQNARGDTTGVTFANGSQSTAQYNSAGEITAATAPDGMASSYTYNSLDELTSETLRRRYASHLHVRYQSAPLVDDRLDRHNHLHV